MASLDTLIQDLVIANRILAKEDVVDAYGHVSVRHPDNPKHFFISRSLAPELIEKTDIVELGLAGQPVADEQRPLHLQRFIHAAIYAISPRARSMREMPATVPIRPRPGAPGNTGPIRPVAATC